MKQKVGRILSDFSFPNFVRVGLDSHVFLFYGMLMLIFGIRFGD